MSDAKKDNTSDLEAAMYATLGGLGIAALSPVIGVPAICGYAIAGAGLYLGVSGFFEDKSKKLFELCGITNKDGSVPICIKKIKTDVGLQRVYSMPKGLSIDDIEKKQDALENAFKKPLRIELAANYNVIITEINKKYAECYKINLKDNIKNDMKFELGMTLNNKNVILDLSGNEMHTGVFGSTGSGKSVCLNILTAQFILKDIELKVIDLKGGVEFSMYRKYPKLTDMAMTPEDATEVLLKLLDTMDKRYDMLFKAECKSYKDYNEKNKKKMNPIVLIIDEYNALIGKEYKEAQKALFALLSRARAANILCIISTQRPSHEVLPGTIKCNIKNFITFKVENEVDSEIVLSQKGNYRAFNELKSEGEGLLKTKGEITNFKCYYLTDAEILEQIQNKLTGSTLAVAPKEPIKEEKHKKATKEDVKKIESLI